MRKSNQSPKQSNTLFNYFTKSQSTPKSNNSAKNSKSDESKTNNSNNGSVASTSKPNLNPTNQQNYELDYDLYDLVWAKLEGYPWWPSIVCLHPSLNNYHKKKGKTVFIHVQFFDDPVSRAWIKLRDLKDYLGKVRSDVPLLKDAKWNRAIEFADQALKMDKSERWTLIADLKPSDDEDFETNDLEEELSDISPKSITKNSSSAQKVTPNSKYNNNEPKSDLKRKGNSSEKDKNDRKKFKRLVLESSDEDFESESEDDYKPEKSDEESSDEEVQEIIESEEEPMSVEGSDSENDSKSKGSSSKSNNKSKSSAKSSFPLFSKNSSDRKSSDSPKPNNNKLNKSRLSLADDSFISVNETVEQNSDKIWPHLGYEFLKPDKIRDKNGKFRLISGEPNPDYDPSTLWVPESFLNNQTPAHRQWWTFKSNYFDTVLFFKMGKFYELFNMDAVIAVNELQIIYMKGDCAHAGFPEKAYKRYADVLIQKGYKVARIEQTETPQMMEERCKKLRKTTKFDKVVARELCRVSTIGTRMSSVIDADMMTDGNSYLLALTENVSENGNEFGVCFIDVSIGKFNLSQFSDDRYCSRLRTLIAHNPPVELIFSRKNISAKTKHLLETCVPNARKEVLKDFWSSNKTLKFLSEGDFFDNGLPDVIIKMLDETDSLHQTCKPEYELAIRSLGAVIEYCSDCLIADEILSMKLFEEYKPCDSNRTVDNNSSVDLPNNMILDCFTLRNLEIFQNSLGGSEGTLYEVLDFCSTPFGKRLMHNWLCAPLCNVKQIEARQMAVTDLSDVNVKYEVEEAIKMLKKLPDLERLLSKIHSQGSAKRAKNHPDSRAILFEMHIYNKRKINDFLTVLKGFENSLKIIENFNSHLDSFKSSILINCLKFEENGGNFPNLGEELKHLDEAFDHKRAEKEGKILLKKEADPEYNSCISKIELITQKLDNYLNEQKKYFGTKVSYFGTGKNRFQLEVPESAAKKITKDNKDYELQSARKGFKRYYTPVIKNLFEELIVAEEAKDAILRDSMRRLFEKFDKSYHKWLAAIKCLALLDVFISLSKCRSFLLQNKANVCLPKFSDSKTPFISLINSSNPCLIKYCDDFIPNDILIESELLLLTGPNMGGKSTLMRQLGLIVILAQIGSYVPAEECLLTPVDRIFTRIGAFDRIVEGESTFFVELSETALILRHVTKHSLVLIDELGRGTSTFDGTAIACSVAKELSENIKCRTLFSSHYHSLVDEFKNNPSVKLVHMACMIENENESDPTEENITFLYKLKQDSCPKSYGFNAAQLAGIPKSVIRNAFKKAQQFEQQNQIEKVCRKVLNNEVNDNEVMAIIPHLRQFSLKA